MKGLIRNNFYSMQSNITLAFIIALILVFTPFLIADSASSIIPFSISAQMLIFVLNTGTSLHADEVAKWNKFELTLPVKRSTIIGAKYISFIALILLGMIMGGVTLICAKFAEFNLDTNSIIWAYGFGLTLSILSIAIMYPCMLKIGTEKNESILLLSFFIAIGIMLVIALLSSNITNGMNWRHPFVGIVSMIVSLVCFASSYLISLRVYRNKEF